MEMRGTPGGGIEFDDEALYWFEKKFRAMSPARKKQFAKTKKPLGMFETILRIMCQHNLDVQRAGEMLVKQLKAGEMEARGRPVREFRYPVSFWQSLSKEQFAAAHIRGYWTQEEIRILWRHLGRDDRPPKTLKFPDVSEARRTTH
jgi:hypothetical protein